MLGADVVNAEWLKTVGGRGGEQLFGAWSCPSQVPVASGLHRSACGLILHWSYAL